jgi:riboflavin biosynthesis pyrimidine reductase
VSRQKAPSRPWLIVSSTASLDGRITFSRTERLLTPEERRRWQSRWPPDVPELIAQRAANIEERHHPTVVLEGSGTFVSDTAHPVPGIPGHHDQSDLRRDWLPKLAPKWFAVVDGRGRVPWSFTGDGLVEEIQMIWFPAVIGGAGTPSSFDGDPLTPEQAPRAMTHLGTVIGRHGSIWSRYEATAELDEDPDHPRR